MIRTPRSLASLPLEDAAAAPAPPPRRPDLARVGVEERCRGRRQVVPGKSWYRLTNHKMGPA